MTQTNVRNPANWLLDLWERLPRAQPYQNKQSLAIWAHVFSLKEGAPEVLTILACVFTNASQAVAFTKRLQTTDQKKSQLITWHAAFRGASLAVAHNSTWQTTLQHFTADRKVHLEYCASELEAALAANSFTSADELAELNKKLDELMLTLAKDAELDDEFKLLLYDLFEAARRAIAEYSIRGNKGVADSFSYIIANVIRYRDKFDTPAKSKWARELREIIAIMADVATVTGYSALAFSSTFSGLLP